MKEESDDDMFMHLLNNRPLDEFDGLSPNEMHYLVHEPFDNNSMLSINTSAHELMFKEVPFLNLVSYFLNQLAETGGVKLTAVGNLPTKMVKAMYEQKYITEDYLEDGLYKLSKQTDSMSVTNARHISELAGLIKNRKQHLSLTQKGEQLSKKDKLPELFLEIFKAYTNKFNWAYNDGYGDNPIGQLGFAYSLLMLSKYGSEKKHFDFYSKKYREAFPSLLMSIEETHFNTKEKEMDTCYALRTFERFLSWFGLIEITVANDSILDKSYEVSKTDIFDQLIVFE